LGPPPPRESYLDGEAIIAIARKSGAQAIHPGYGFLSENEGFAAACAREGVLFIGPPPAAIAAMGSKSAAKGIMGKAGVPLVPGYHGDDQDPELLAREAAKIGYPVLIKAVAGGGGKGMKIVERKAEFAAALASARREAKSGFGDDRVLIEKYLAAPRHIEIQVFADTRGNAVYLFERDCSVQRRHQKVLEEAPAPRMKPEHRRAMGTAAVACAKAIGYVGAGTVEFIAADSFDRDGAFYFMEMNTRLQVEHPVTEMVTGEDLVEWQLRVASGEPLPKRQEELALSGHAIEAHIYAEDPERGFLPSIGTIKHLRAPATSAPVRVDTGVRAGDEISAYYDPMIAKLIVHGADRTAALARMREALAEYEIVGVATNVAFLRRVVAHDAFATGNVDTGLIGRNHAALFPPRPAASREALLAAALAEVQALAAERACAARASGDPRSPWHAVDPWWPNSNAHAISLILADGDTRHSIVLRRDGDAWRVALGDVEVPARVAERDGRLVIVTPESESLATVVRDGDLRHVFSRDGRATLTLIDPLAHAGVEEAHGGHLTAPMSGLVVAVMVNAGEKVAKGAPLMILEAMKMEHTIAAPAAGTVKAVNFAAGDRVKEGADLVDLDDA
ncbi:MAG TPA: biotin carboxylase N-terminal domain-containing protein, partial [Casimicrobiaceae bacterium]|nr:biotin carboxylase N-terminal domain-containing protein [Casimicrobiaceae bacterium]